MDDDERSEAREDEAAGLIWHVGPVEVDLPRTLGYYGGIAAAFGFGMIVPELAVFIALVPLIKLLKRRRRVRLERAVVGLFEGVAKPVGGDAASMFRRLR